MILTVHIRMISVYVYVIMLLSLLRPQATMTPLYDCIHIHTLMLLYIAYCVGMFILIHNKNIRCLLYTYTIAYLVHF